MIASRVGPRNQTNMNDRGISAFSARNSGGTASWGARAGRVFDDDSDEVTVVAIGGFDPGGGAGVVRDFLTGRTLGAAVRLVPSAWTEQSPAGVHGVEPRDPHRLNRAVRLALTEIGGAASLSDALSQTDRARRGREPRAGRLVLKIGMLPDERAVQAVAEAIGDFTGPIVLDPVLAASSGGILFRGDPAALLRLGMRATLVTPNAPEAAVLTGIEIRALGDAADAGRAMVAGGAPAVLVKGGHIGGGKAIDLLVTTGDPAVPAREFSAPRHPGHPVRGTGCALATAIAVALGRGLALPEAVGSAKVWLDSARRQAVRVGGEWHLP
jgi:hydroxymethylpyrimidine/phosphomethylpyrimidine kinase